MSDISKHPFDTEASPADIDEYMKIAAIPGAPQEFMHEWEVTHGYAQRDSMNPSIIREVIRVVPVAAAAAAAVAAPKVSVTLAGVTYEADTLEELQAKYQPALTAIMQANAAKNNDAPARTNDGRFAKQPSVTNAADQITNGLVTKALQEELGISPEELQAAVAGIREGNQIVTTWAAATKEFLKANPDYRGGEETQQAIGRKLQELGLTEQPSAASIQRAYDALAEEAETYLKIKDATDPQSIRDALGITQREQDRLRHGR